MWLWGNQSIFHWSELDTIIKTNANEILHFKIQSKASKKKQIVVPIQSTKNRNIFELQKTVGYIQGLNPLSTGTKVGVISPESKAYKQGFRTFDEITHIQKQKVRYWRDLEFLIQKTAFPMTVQVTRWEGKQKKTKTFSNLILKERSIKNWGLESLDLYLKKVGKGTPADKVGLKVGDRLLTVNGKTLVHWEEVLNTIKNYSEEQPLKISYRREGKVYRTSIHPQKMYVEGHLKEKPMIGIASASFILPSEEKVKKYSVAGALVYSGEQTVHWLRFIALGLVRLVQGKVSPRTMGGPVAIGRIAHKSFHAGFSSFFIMMAVISLSLFFFNLLPIPMLDGGHILFFTLEGVLRRPLDTKKLLIAQQLGMGVLLCFFAFVFFNDILNWLNAW